MTEMLTERVRVRHLKVDDRVICNEVIGVIVTLVVYGPYVDVTLRVADSHAEKTVRMYGAHRVTRMFEL